MAASAQGSRAGGTKVAGVLFDLGGTLITYEGRDQIAQAAAAALVRMGLDPAAPEVRAARRAAAEEVEREYATRRSFLHRDLFRERVARTALRLGVDPPASVLDQFTVEHTELLVRHMPPRPDTIATLQELRARGLYCAVVSNADDDYLHAALEHHGLAPLLDDWTSSEEAASCKPDPGIYDHAVRKAGLASDQLLFVGDSLQHDVAGAHRVGLRSVLISDGSPAPLSTGLEAVAEPDFRIEQLAELVPIVDGLNGG
jgi:putative hydrolase of the HAD superfamily